MGTGQKDGEKGEWKGQNGGGKVVAIESQPTEHRKEFLLFEEVIIQEVFDAGEEVVTRIASVDAVIAVGVHLHVELIV